MIAQLVYVVTKWPTLLTVYTLKIRHLKMLQQHSCVTGFFSLRNKAGFVRKTCWKGLSCVGRKVYCFEWDFEAQVLIEKLIRCDNLQKRFKRRECHLDCLLRFVQIQIRDLLIKNKIEIGKKCLKTSTFCTLWFEAKPKSECVENSKNVSL